MQALDIINYNNSQDFRRGIERATVNAAATGSVALDLNTGCVFILTLSGNVTLSFSNATVPTGSTRSIVLRITQTGTRRIVTWPAGITWLGPVPQSPLANKITEYVFSTENGTTWIGREGAGN